MVSIRVWAMRSAVEASSIGEPSTGVTVLRFLRRSFRFWAFALVRAVAARVRDTGGYSRIKAPFLRAASTSIDLPSLFSSLFRLGIAHAVARPRPLSHSFRVLIRM